MVRFAPMRMAAASLAVLVGGCVHAAKTTEVSTKMPRPVPDKYVGASVSLWKPADPIKEVYGDRLSEIRVPQEVLDSTARVSLTRYKAKEICFSVEDYIATSNLSSDVNPLETRGMHVETSDGTVLREPRMSNLSVGHVVYRVLLKADGKSSEKEVLLPFQRALGTACFDTKKPAIGPSTAWVRLVEDEVSAPDVVFNIDDTMPPPVEPAVKAAGTDETTTEPKPAAPEEGFVGRWEGNMTVETVTDGRRLPSRTQHATIDVTRKDPETIVLEALDGPLQTCKWEVHTEGKAGTVTPGQTCTIPRAAKIDNTFKSGRVELGPDWMFFATAVDYSFLLRPKVAITGSISFELLARASTKRPTAPQPQPQAKTPASPATPAASTPQLK